MPPVNIGPRSTPNYAHFTGQAIHDIGGGRRVFAGQRAEGFFVDLGSIFDLGTLRPFESLHLIPTADAVGVNGTQGLNVHTIAIQVPKTDLTRGAHRPTDVMDARLGDRRLGDRRAGRSRRCTTTAPALCEWPRSVDPGLAAGQPAVQRGHRADGREGPVEPPRPR